MTKSTMTSFRIYTGDGDRLVQVPEGCPHLNLMPSGDPRLADPKPGIRIQWGQHLLSDVVHGRYRTLICGVNDTDNSRGVLGEILSLVPTSQWTLGSATSYAKVFRQATHLHAQEDREPYVLKFDLDRLLVLALLRPAGRNHFTLEDIHRGFSTVSKMLQGRHDRQPAAAVSFLGARSNVLVNSKGVEASFESVLDAMHKAGFTGDVYPPVAAWDRQETGVYARFPFPEQLDRMREGSS
ncbi:MAG: hypothetical protein FJ270_03390 [Planctomycetes bacterium]|nr:hypothetical protein [Planctomycetota bacterium]